MPDDYEIVNVVVSSLEGIIADAGKKLEMGLDLSKEKIDYGLPRGIHADFCALVDDMKKIDEKHHFGYRAKLESLYEFGSDNWSELLMKARILLGIAKQFQLNLEPPAHRIKLDR